MKIDKLKITLGEKRLVDISFEIKSSLALVGESGSGKSLTTKALLAMLPCEMELELEYNCDFRLEAGKSVALVPQNPFTALSPLTKIAKQFFLDEMAVAGLLEMVGLDASLMHRFPPELSGGQLQRVVIAMALASKPKLLLLDEPTTALDEQTKELVLKLLLSLSKREGFKMLFVTHDIESVRDLCEDICVIQNGKVVEYATMSSVMESPKDPYTKRLIEANFANRKFRT